MFRRLEDVLKEMRVDDTFIQCIREFSSICQYSYYIRVEEHTDVLDLRGILRVDEELSDDEPEKYYNKDSLNEVLNDMLTSSMFDKECIKSSYEGLDLIVRLNQVRLLESVKDYIDANI